MQFNKNIKYHTLPRWLQPRLKGTPHLLHGMLINCPRLDHWGYDKETKAFILEPYDLSMDKTRKADGILPQDRHDIYNQRTKFLASRQDTDH